MCKAHPGGDPRALFLRISPGPSKPNHQQSWEEDILRAELECSTTQVCPGFEHTRLVLATDPAELSSGQIYIWRSLQIIYFAKAKTYCQKENNT